MQAPPEPKEVKLGEKEILEAMVRTGQGDEKVWLKQRREEPVVGYTGFLRGVKAENEYGRDYRALAGNSIRR